MVWLMIHRFRIGWLEHQTETVGLDIAIKERRAQAPDAIRDAVTDSRPANEDEEDAVESDDEDEAGAD